MLLAVRADCRELCSPLGSELAAHTLDKHSVKHNFQQTVPCIQQANGTDMCPMEKLSLGKSPEEFYGNV